MVKHYNEENLFELIQSNIKFILSFIIISNFFIIFLLKFSIRLKAKFDLFFKTEGESVDDKNNKNKDVLLITAHPDDEIMFFAPTIKTLISQKIRVRILCLSNGDFEGKGKVREEELANVCKNLKIEDFLIVHDDELKDEMKLKWKEEVVVKRISEYLNEENIDKIGSIITFDEEGVTKHLNHISCSEGFMGYLKANKERIKNKKINCFLLDSHSAISQYTFLFPFVFFYFKEFGFFNKNLMFNWRMMRMHQSQFNFMRKLHIVFSSYTYYNTYTKIEFRQ